MPPEPRPPPRAVSLGPHDRRADVAPVRRSLAAGLSTRHPLSRVAAIEDHQRPDGGFASSAVVLSSGTLCRRPLIGP